MNKKLHFSAPLVSIILSGDKHIAWRFADDKSLNKGDLVDFLESGTEKHFATAKILKIWEKTFGTLDENDKRGHEKFANEKEMYQTYRRYYQRQIQPNDVVKVKLIKII